MPASQATFMECGTATAVMTAARSPAAAFFMHRFTSSSHLIESRKAKISKREH